MDMNSQCDCRTRASLAKVLNLDGQVIATGPLKLSDGESASGWFEPDSESLLRNVLDANTYPEVLADLGTHQHKLLNFSRLLDRAGQPSLTAGPFGELIVNHRFYFQLALPPSTGKA